MLCCCSCGRMGIGRSERSAARMSPRIPDLQTPNGGTPMPRPWFKSLWTISDVPLTKPAGLLATALDQGEMPSA